MEHFRLGKYTDVDVGQILTRVTDDSVTDGEKLTVLSPKSINEGAIEPKNLKEIYAVKRIEPEKFTVPGDVVIKLSSPYDAAYVDEKNEGYLIPSFIAAVRVRDHEKIDARFLAALFNTLYIRNQLQAIQTGAKRPMIRVSELREIEIPDIGIEKMRRIGEEYLLSCEKRHLLTEIIDIERSIMESTILTYAMGD